MTDNIQKNKTIVKNSVFLYIRMLFAVIINLYASRLLLSTLGIENYGVYNIVGGVVSLMMFVNTAMQTSTIRFITYSVGGDTIENTKSIVSAAFQIHFWIMIFIIVIAETVGLWFVNTKLNIPDASFTAAKWVYQCSIISSCIAIIQVPLSSLVVSYERFDIYAIIELLHVILKCGIIFLLPFSQDRLITYAVLLLFVSVVVFSFYLLYAYKRIPTFSIERKLNIIIAKPMIKFAVWSLFGNGTYAISRQGTNILINNFFGVTANAAGGVATQASSVVSQFVSTVQSAFNPQIIKSYSLHDITRMRYLLIKESEIMILLAALAFTPLFINMDFIMKLWLTNVPNYAVAFCRILLLCNIIQMITNIQAVAIQATGKNQIFSLLIGIINLLCVICVYVCYKMNMDAPVAYIVFLLAFMCKLIIELFLLHLYIPDLQVYKILVGNIKPFAILVLAFVLCMFLPHYISSEWLSLFITFVVNTVSVTVLSIILFPQIRTKIKSIYNERIKKIV